MRLYAPLDISQQPGFSANFSRDTCFSPLVIFTTCILICIPPALFLLPAQGVHLAQLVVYVMCCVDECVPIYACYSKTVAVMVASLLQYIILVPFAAFSLPWNDLFLSECFLQPLHV